jgi:hypothetical protein
MKSSTALWAHAAGSSETWTTEWREDDANFKTNKAIALIRLTWRWSRPLKGNKLMEQATLGIGQMDLFRRGCSAYR